MTFHCLRHHNNEIPTALTKDRVQALALPTSYGFAVDPNYFRCFQGVGADATARREVPRIQIGCPFPDVSQLLRTRRLPGPLGCFGCCLSTRRGRAAALSDSRPVLLLVTNLRTDNVPPRRGANLSAESPTPHQMVLPPRHRALFVVDFRSFDIDSNCSSAA